MNPNSTVSWENRHYGDIVRGWNRGVITADGRLSRICDITGRQGQIMRDNART